MDGNLRLLQRQRRSVSAGGRVSTLPRHRVTALGRGLLRATMSCDGFRRQCLGRQFLKPGAGSGAFFGREDGALTSNQWEIITEETRCLAESQERERRNADTTRKRKGTKHRRNDTGKKMQAKLLLCLIQKDAAAPHTAGYHLMRAACDKSESGFGDEEVRTDQAAIHRRSSLKAASANDVGITLMVADHQDPPGAGHSSATPTSPNAQPRQNRSRWG